MTTAQLDAINALEEATKAALQLLAVIRNADGDADEWTRLFSPSGRCPVSGRSRSWINAHGEIRKKTVQGARYYAAGDVRKLIQGGGR